jgi:hypothetical protein
VGCYVIASNRTGARAGNGNAQQVLRRIDESLQPRRATPASDIFLVSVFPTESQVPLGFAFGPCLRKSSRTSYAAARCRKTRATSNPFLPIAYLRYVRSVSGQIETAAARMKHAIGLFPTSEPQGRQGRHHGCLARAADCYIANTYNFAGKSMAFKNSFPK